MAKPRAAEPAAHPPHLARIESVRDLRRAQIIDKARALVVEGGLEALTIAALESRLDFTRGVITYHFRNKEEIVGAVLEDAIAEIDAAIAREVSAEASFEDQLRAALRATVRGYTERREAGLILMAYWGRLGTDRPARERNAALYAGYRKQSRALVAAGQAAGVFAKAPDPDTLAALLVGIVIGIATQVYFDPGAIDPAAVVEEAADALLARLAGEARAGAARRGRDA